MEGLRHISATRRSVGADTVAHEPIKLFYGALTKPAIR